MDEGGPPVDSTKRSTDGNRIETVTDPTKGWHAPPWVLQGIVAGIYWLLAKLSLMLALPSGYAAPFWPAAGFGLAVVLYAGKRYLPAIVAAAFLVRAGAFWETSTVVELLRSVLVPAAIALGMALQLTTGAWLLKRYGNYPNRLAAPSDIVSFMLLGGPVACLISATIGVTALALGGLISWPEVAFNWTTWWVGDIVGVMLVAPVVLLWLDPQARPRRLPTTLPLLGVLAVVLVAHGLAYRVERNRLQADLLQRATYIEAGLRRGVDLYFENLYAIGHFFDTEGHVSREDFAAFTRPILARRPGIQALEWTPRVRGDERRDFVAAARASGLSDYRLRELSPADKLVDRDKADEYFPILYVEPQAGNEAAFGYDIASSPLPKANLQLARDTGQLAISEPVVLVQERRLQRGVVAYLPIYQPHRPISTVEERRQALRGVIAGVFRLEDVLSFALSDLDLRGVTVRLEDASAPASQRTLYASADRDLSRPGLQRSLPLYFGNQKWLLQLEIDRVSVAGSQSLFPWTVLSGGLLFSALLTAFLLVVTGRSAEIEALVVKRTGELNEANRQLVFLAEAGAKLSETALQSDRLAEQLGSLCVPALADWWAIDLVSDGRIERLGGDGRQADMPANAQEPILRRLSSQVLETGQPLLITHTGPERLRELGLDDERRPIEHLGIRALMVLPLRTRHGLLGVLMLGSCRPERRYGQTELSLAMEIGRRAALAIDNAALYQASQDAVRARDEFLSIASHELRTPITSMKLGIQGLLSGLIPATPDNVRETMERTHRQLLRLSRLVSELLSVSRIQVGRLRLNLQATDLAEVVKTTTDLFASDLTKAGCQLSVDTMPAVGRWDQGALEQIVANLLSNAAKFAAGKPVAITLTTDEQRARLVVADRGIGIPQDRLPDIFKPFERGVSVRHYGGLGLGLYIVDRLVTAMGGTVRAENQPGGGAVFTVELPLAGPPTPPGEAEA